MISLPLTGQGQGVCLPGVISGELYKRRFSNFSASISNHHYEARFQGNGASRRS